MDKHYISKKYRNAMARISGALGEPSSADFSDTVMDLQSIAEFSPGAKAKLAVLTELGAGTKQDSSDAADLFLAAAGSGLPPLVRELGALVLMHGGADGVAGALLKQAAQAGDWIAAFLILREAERGRYFLGPENLKILATVLAPSVPFVEQIKTTISELAIDIRAIPDTAYDSEICQSASAMPPSFAEVESTFIHLSDPVVKSRTAVLTPFQCDYLIAMSAALMQPSKVVDADIADSKKQGYRTSDGAVFLPHSLDRPLIRILNSINHAAGVQPQNGEFLALLRYQPGQEYYPHHDYLHEDTADYSKVKACGQRCATMLTYLNDDYTGGETAFPTLNINYKGNTGDSLYFSNTDTDGQPIPASLHAGRAIVSGEKWLATLWIREKSFWPWVQ